MNAFEYQDIFTHSGKIAKTKVGEHDGMICFSSNNFDKFDLEQGAYNTILEPIKNSAAEQYIRRNGYPETFSVYYSENNVQVFDEAESGNNIVYVTTEGNDRSIIFS